MALEITSDRIVCTRCGTAYTRYKNNFYVSYGEMHKGTGYLPICKSCVDTLFQTYLGQCGKSEYAMRQICRKLDLYWDKGSFDYAFKKGTSRTLISLYMTRINTLSNAGKSYDDTLMEEDSLWSFKETSLVQQEPEETDEDVVDAVAEKKVTRKMVKFWGSAYSPEMILQLEERYKYWMGRLPSEFEIDIGTEILLKQISALDIDINNCRVSDGKNVDKLINTQSKLLQDLNLKPVQRKKDDGDSLNDIPFGVGIAWCEQKKPIAEPLEEFKDVDGIRKYIMTWVYGHLVKMMGKKNLHSRLYDQEIAKWRVERPEFSDEEDEDFIADALSGEDESG